MFAQVDGGARRHRGQVVQQGAGQLLDLLGHGVDPADRERGADEPAQPPVLRAVGGEHVAGGHPDRQRPGGDGLGEVRPVLEAVLGHPGVLEQFLQQLRVGHRPGPHPQEVDGRRRAALEQLGGLGIAVATGRVQYESFHGGSFGRVTEARGGRAVHGVEHAAARRSRREGLCGKAGDGSSDLPAP